MSRSESCAEAVRKGKKNMNGKTEIIKHVCENLGGGVKTNG